MLRNNRSGFTLIELTLVVAIIGILASITMLRVGSGVYDSSKTSTDNYNLRTLNASTTSYAAAKGLLPADVFSGAGSDAARMQTLINNGYLANIVIAKMPGASFYWSNADQLWHYTGTAAGTVYDFMSLTSLAGFRSALDWGASGPYPGTLTPGVGLTSSSGLLFMPNNNDQYTITTTAQLSGNYNGGYGIFFDTSLTASNQDTGYVLQFDRGYGANGAIIIKSRVNGNEISTPLIAVSGSSVSSLPTSNSSPWWDQQHNVQISVSNVVGSTGQKQVSVMIDGSTVIQSLQYASSITAANNYTGVRSWNYSTTYQQVSVLPQ